MMGQDKSFDRLLRGEITSRQYTDGLKKRVDAGRIRISYRTMDRWARDRRALQAEVERLHGENERLRALLADVEPFIGWPADVRELNARVRSALDEEDRNA